MSFRYGLLAPCWLLLLLLLAGAAAAQAPAWSGVAPGSLAQPNGTSIVQAMAVDGSGNVFVTGYFNGTVTFGTTQLVSDGDGRDLFVGKWLPVTNTWAWIQRGGGSGYDAGFGLAVSGSNIYVVGELTNNNTNSFGVSFGPGNVQYGVANGGFTGTGGSGDMLLVKYVDNGTSAAVAWSQVAGGIANDEATSVAVNGNSVYLTGYVVNTRTNLNTVVFGGSGATAGTAVQNGATAAVSNDLVVAKYTDNGSSATFGWSHIGGGTGADEGRSIAVSGTSLYVTGTVTNTRANAQGVLFGGSGTAVGTASQYGASTISGTDQVLAKYTDNGTSGTLGWTQVAGGSGNDFANDVAASGNRVYVAGAIFNNRANANAVLLGGAGTAVGTAVQYGASTTASNDLVLTKYTDNGTTATVTWTQVAGGTDADVGTSVVVNGSSLYVAGYVNNNQANATAVVFGGSGTAAGTATQLGVNPTASADLLVARYSDNGSTATFDWSQVGGGTTADSGLALAVSGSTVYVGGYTASNRSAAFGSATGSPIIGTFTPRAVLAQLSSQASSGTWQAITATSNGGFSYVQAATTDAAGNVLVAGRFFGQVAFGNSVLSCATDGDLFLAKYIPSTGTWAWAQSGGGAGRDEAMGIAVSGTNVYLTGTVTNTTGSLYGVRFGGTGPTTHTAAQYGASATTNSGGAASDIFVAKYTDNGSSVAFGWSQVAGGTSEDYGHGIAVSGNNVYVTGILTNNLANAQAVVLGSSGTTPGTAPQPGASTAVSEDLVLIKYVDNGPNATVAWSQVGGGTSYDSGGGVALNGANVYVTGYITNNLANATQVAFGGSGTTPGTAPQYGPGTSNYQSIVVAKYIDQGSSASVGWTQVGGGINNSHGQGIASVGNQVYVTGFLSATTASGGRAVFGGSGTVPGTVLQAGATASNTHELVVAKYIDNGSSAAVAWTQVGGGTQEDEGQAIVVQGTGVYVVGAIYNNTSNANQVVFGGAGTTAGSVLQPGASTVASDDVVVAKYIDNGASATLAWTQVAGGTGSDVGTGVGTGSMGLYVAGYAQVPANFGTYTLSGPRASTFGFVGSFGATALPVRVATKGGSLVLYPNPARDEAVLRGTAPGAPVQVLDALGRTVFTAAADATGAAHLALPSYLPAGVYIVRSGTQAVHLVVE